MTDRQHSHLPLSLTSSKLLVLSSDSSFDISVLIVQDVIVQGFQLRYVPAHVV